MKALVPVHAATSARQPRTFGCACTIVAIKDISAHARDKYPNKMLGDTKVDFLDSRLESFKLKQQSTQNDLQVSYEFGKSRLSELISERTS